MAGTAGGVEASGLWDGAVDPGEAVALAWARGPDGEVVASWRPDGLETEPAFLVYSVTKVFLATLALQLVREGRLGLDALLARWRPEVPGADGIRVRDLLAHRAGLPDYGGVPAYHEAVGRSPGRPWDAARFAAETWETGLRSRPGSAFLYSNPGYGLLLDIVEQVSDRDFGEAVQERIARPLGLERTRRVATPDDLARVPGLAPGPSRQLSPDGAPRDARHHYHPGWVFHAVLVSTASEVARFLQALAAGRLVDARALDAMRHWQPVLEAPAPWRRPSYGLGLMGDPASPWGLIWGHNGAGPGYSASAFHAEAAGPGGLSLCVLRAGEAGPDAEALLRSALDRLAPGEPGAEA